MREPFRISLDHVEGIASPEKILANVAANSPGAAFVQARRPHGLPLAIVGGGRSVLEHLDELRSWPGHIWALNGTCAWLASQDIKSVLFTVDPGNPEEDPQSWNLGALDRVETALISTSCDPVLFKRLAGRAFAFHTHGIESQGLFARAGSTSAIRAQTLSLLLGFHDTTYFGCEGSWGFGTHSHTTKDEIQEALVIRAGNVDYVTNLQLMLQSQELACVIKAFPGVFKEQSGGLLRAMIEHEESWEVVALSTPLRNRMDPTATEPYRAAA